MTSHKGYLRLAFRVEGEMWNAYAALIGTMEGAHLLGSVRLGLVQHPDRKAAFMALMQDALSDLLTDALGASVSWPDPPAPAPAHERAGRA